jgi:AcrR family transcriptional regulator
MLSSIDIRRATNKLADAREREQEAEAEWQLKIRIAVGQGMPVADVANAAGVSKARIYQIRDRRR